MENCGDMMFAGLHDLFLQPCNKSRYAAHIVQHSRNQNANLTDTVGVLLLHRFAKERINGIVGKDCYLGISASSYFLYS